MVINMPKKTWLLHSYYNKTMVNFHKVFIALYTKQIVSKQLYSNKQTMLSMLENSSIRKKLSYNYLHYSVIIHLSSIGLLCSLSIVSSTVKPI